MLLSSNNRISDRTYHTVRNFAQPATTEYQTELIIQLENVTQSANTEYQTELIIQLEILLSQQQQNIRQNLSYS
jgi:hypothetical protein